jgi:hypothetical protein
VSSHFAGTNLYYDCQRTLIIQTTLTNTHAARSVADLQKASTCIRDAMMTQVCVEKNEYTARIAFCQMRAGADLRFSQSRECAAQRKANIHPLPCAVKSRRSLLSNAHFGGAYLLIAGNIVRPLLLRLQRVHQPVPGTPNLFSSESTHYGHNTCKISR